jgi:phosphoribosylformylglycinamidine (FGAM) synthase-like enzyme
MVVKHKGEVVADIPVDPLAEAAPEYDRPWGNANARSPSARTCQRPTRWNAGALTGMLIGGPQLCRALDLGAVRPHGDGRDTGAGRPGGDAAVVRVHGTNKALAVTCDCTPRYVTGRPVAGGANRRSRKPGAT